MLGQTTTGSSLTCINDDSAPLHYALSTIKGKRNSVMGAKKLLSLAVCVLVTTLSNDAAFAQQHSSDQQQIQKQAQSQDRKQLYGYDLMTEQERAEHREKMRSMKTEQEREAYRMQHHEEMQRRAREQGVEIPDEPPRPGQGKGKGQGQGKGYGQSYGDPDQGSGAGAGKGGGKGR
jgi:hypothetical protein